jgi:hypothetical protein
MHFFARNSRTDSAVRGRAVLMRLEESITLQFPFEISSLYDPGPEDYIFGSLWHQGVQILCELPREN